MPSRNTVSPLPKIIECKYCGKKVDRKGKYKLYCNECARTIKTHLKNKAAQISVDNAATMSWGASEPVALRWFTRIAVPFSYNYSKNSMLRFTKTGRAYTPAESRSARDALTLLIKSKIDTKKVVRGKLWVDLMVQKPDMRGDAVNVLDVMCDAIQDATGLNDRFYAVRRLDWEIVKVNPVIMIGLGQEHNIAHDCCMGCGQWYLLKEGFYKDKSRRSGYDTICKECYRNRK